MRAEGAVILFAVPAALVIATGGVLAAHRVGWISDEASGRMHKPAKWLSYIVLGWLVVSFLTGTITILFDWRPEAKFEALLLGPLYWAMWFAPYIVAGALLRLLASTAGQALPQRDTDHAQRYQCGTIMPWL